MIVRLVNDYHKTSIRVNLNYGDLILAKRIKVWRNKLCGMTMCSCSGELGTRGPQEDLWAKGLEIDCTADSGDRGDRIVVRH